MDFFAFASQNARSEFPIADVIRQMLADWNNATEQQRQDALAAAKRMADAAERRTTR